MGAPVPVALYAQGETVWRDLRESPPAGAAWGRFLVAMGELAADHVHDARAAFTLLHAALERAQATADAEVGAAAAFNLGVLAERKQDLARARQIYREGAEAVARHGTWTAPALRCVERLVSVALHLDDQLSRPEQALLKQAWLAWFAGVDGVNAELDDRLLRTVAACLLPEDDPAALAERWRTWPPHVLDDQFRDDTPACLLALYAAAIRAAESHLSDEPAAAEPYRVLYAAALRLVEPSAKA